MPRAEQSCPEPLALRLVGLRPGRRPPRPPLGLREWSASADADAGVAVLLEVSGDANDEVAALASAIPDSDAFPRGVLVVVLENAVHDGGLVARLFHAPRVSRAARASALLSRGYVSIGAAEDRRSGQDLVWGYAP
jgi:hypothetical protein